MDSHHTFISREYLDILVKAILKHRLHTPGKFIAEDKGDHKPFKKVMEYERNETSNFSSIPLVNSFQNHNMVIQDRNGTKSIQVGIRHDKICICDSLTDPMKSVLTNFPNITMELEIWLTVVF